MGVSTTRATPVRKRMARLPEERKNIHGRSLAMGKGSTYHQQRAERSSGLGDHNGGKG